MCFEKETVFSLFDTILRKKIYSYLTRHFEKKQYFLYSTRHFEKETVVSLFDTTFWERSSIFLFDTTFWERNSIFLFDTTFWERNSIFLFDVTFCRMRFILKLPHHFLMSEDKGPRKARHLNGWIFNSSDNTEFSLFRF